MPEFSNDGFRLRYETHGSGRPVVLLHGGAVSFAQNYARFGWIEALAEHGFQAIGLDLRGHGRSDKPHDASAYGTANLAGDVLALFDHLGVAHAPVVAYSIGTAVALELMRRAPERVERAALVATGDGLIGHPPHAIDTTLSVLRAVADRTEYPADLPRHIAAYWNMIEDGGGDRAAMRAVAQASYPPLTEAEAAAIAVPTLVVSGALDPVVGQGPRLAAALGNGRYLEIEGADHFSLAADPRVKAAVVAFLAEGD